jgi:hypothetical protein
MNDYLNPIFRIILPRIEENKIDYWVYGGISIAAYAGNFIRNNHDVDIFTREVDFKKTEIILEELCKQNNFELKPNCQKSNERPKIEIKIDGIERFSMIPIYPKNDIVIFKYKDGDQEYPKKILEKVERNISGFRFFTTQDQFIKDMFKKHILARPDKKKRKKIIKDAMAILNLEERASLGFPAH